MDERESELCKVFFAGDSLKACLVSLCNSVSHVSDPITHVALIALNSPLRIQLSQ